MTDYVAALMYLVPDARISYTNVEVAYADIEWQDERPQPSQAECDAIWPQAHYELEHARVEQARRQRYTNETDGIFFAAQRADGDLTEWKAAVDAIKAELPYPVAPAA
jgi:hypothetical protein